MTPIELTQDQEDKLLEMAKELFTDYRWYIEDSIVEQYHGINDDEIYEEEIALCKIHWFEFCIVKLYPNIQASMPKTIGHSEKLMEEYGILWDICNYDFTKIHPVDYLYKQFQKIRLI